MVKLRPVGGPRVVRFIAHTAPPMSSAPPATAPMTMKGIAPSSAAPPDPTPLRPMLPPAALDGLGDAEGLAVREGDGV